jgi:hypothetical protein
MHDGAGLHGRVERCARGVTVCLLPGLTARQRRAVIRRLRQEASRGFGPPLPLPHLAIALGLDRVRMATRIVRAIVRLHPAVTLVPSAFVVAMMTLFVIAAGDRPGLAPGPGRGLADAAVVSGSAAVVLGSSPSPRRVTRVTVADGGGSWAGGTGLGSGQRASATQAHRSRSKGKRQGRPRQLACRRPAPRTVPHTDHRPGPLDFAW